MDANVAARLAAFQLTGFQIAPSELIDASTGDVLQGKAFRQRIKNSRPPESALQSMFHEVLFRGAEQRKKHYSAFEHTLTREMRYKTIIPVGNENLDSRLKRLELMNGMDQSENNETASHVLIYFRYHGTARRTASEMEAARRLLARWPIFQEHTL